MIFHLFMTIIFPQYFLNHDIGGITLTSECTNSSFIGLIVNVTVDRPLGNRHPEYGFLYSVNYGYIPNTISGDGEELDAYILGIYEPVKTFSGKVIAVIHRLNDDDDKLIVVPTDCLYSDLEIKQLTNFQEQYFQSVIIR